MHQQTVLRIDQQRTPPPPRISSAAFRLRKLGFGPDQPGVKTRLGKDFRPPNRIAELNLPRNLTLG